MIMIDVAEYKRILNQRDTTIIEQADTIAQLRAELARLKPSWKDAPEWAEWIAMDDDGEWNWHMTKPSIISPAYHWIASNRIRPVSVIDGWKDTLERRPEVE